MAARKQKTGEPQQVAKKQRGRAAVKPSRARAAKSSVTRAPKKAAATGVHAASAPAPLKAPMATRGTTGPGAPPTVDFEDFFGRVGEGLVKAQERLDARSQDYVRGLAGQLNVLPSTFRIPKLSADLKFDLDVTNTEKVGFIFHTDETTQETRNQQTISFDIVAVPATQVPPAPVSVTMPFSDSQREAVFSKLAGLNEASLAKALANRDRVLLSTPDGGSSYLVQYAEQGAPTNVGFWYLLVDPAAVVVVRKFGDVGNPAGLTAWQKSLIAQADAQEKYLKTMRQSGS